MRNLIKLLPVFISVLGAQTQPKRIVSTFPSGTEALFALGLGDRVVGVSTYCRYPPAVLSLPKIGSYSKPDAEKIALLTPDLVVIPHIATGLADRLASLKIHTVQTRFDSLPEIYAMIRDIGDAAGVHDKAQILNAQIQNRLADLRRSTEGQPKPSVLLIVGRTPGLLTNLIAAGPSTYLTELLDIAGGINALQSTAISYPHISLETVIRLNPDVILDMSMMGEATEPRIHEERLRQSWLSHPELRAVRSGRVYGLSSEILVTPGPRVAEAVEQIQWRLRADVREKVAQ